MTHLGEGKQPCLTRQLIELPKQVWQHLQRSVRLAQLLPPAQHPTVRRLPTTQQQPYAVLVNVLKPKLPKALFPQLK